MRYIFEVSPTDPATLEKELNLPTGSITEITITPENVVEVEVADSKLSAIQLTDIEKKLREALAARRLPRGKR